MKFFLSFILLSFLSVWCIIGQEKADPELRKIKSKIGKIVIKDSHCPDLLVEQWFAGMNENGSWDDINYNDPSRAKWQPIIHLQRIKRMSVCYLSSGSQFYQVDSLLERVLKGFEFYVNIKPSSLNWFWWQIGVPREVSEIMLLIQDELDSENYKKGLSLIRPPKGLTGQNGVWEAGNQIRKGVLLADSEMIIAGKDLMKSQLLIAAKKDAIQPDYSFQQHGRQIYNGGYGVSFVEDISMWMYILSDSKYTFEPAKVKVFSDLMLEGNAWLTYEKLIDYQVQGREITRQFSHHSEYNNDKKAYRFIQPLKWMMEVDKENRAEYEKYIQHIERQVPYKIGTKAFYHSDFMVHRKNDFYISLKMCSKRTIGTETYNSENTKGIFLPFGATWIYRTATEYDEIFPVWDWQRIPGTTLDQYVEIPRFSELLPGTADFVGMAQYKNVGVATMDYSFHGVKAKKLWYFFDKGMIALGAGISSENDTSTFSTINQCWSKGDIKYDTVGGKIEVFDSVEARFSNMNWLWHDSIGYFFPESEKVYLKNDIQQGCWHTINQSMSTDTVEGKVFTLAVTHDEKEESDYFYYMLPGITAYELENYSYAPQVDVLQNNEKMQVLFDRTYGTTVAVFHRMGKLKTEEYKLAVSKPCIVFFERNVDELVFAIADPTQSEAELKVGVDIPVQGNDVEFDKEKMMYWITVKLPYSKDRQYNGSTVVKRVLIK